MQWIAASEHLPLEDVYHLCYSEPFHDYWMAKWTPNRGWVDEANQGLRLITHWFDFPLPMNFVKSEEDKETLLKKYGMSDDDNKNPFMRFVT